MIYVWKGIKENQVDDTPLKDGNWPFKSAPQPSPLASRRRPSTGHLPSHDPDATIFRHFRQLGAQNLLHLQNRVSELEAD